MTAAHLDHLWGLTMVFAVATFTGFWLYVWWTRRDAMDTESAAMWADHADATEAATTAERDAITRAIPRQREAGE